MLKGGRTCGLQTIARDMTDRKRSEQVPREREDDYRRPGNKKAAGKNLRLGVESRSALIPIVANGFHRTPFLGFFAAPLLVRVFGLLVNE